MLTLLATITASALKTTKERTATKVSFNDVTPLLQFLSVKMLSIISNFGRVYFLSKRNDGCFSYTYCSVGGAGRRFVSLSPLKVSLLHI